MIGLDTNVIVRYLTQDDLVQSRVAANLVEHRLTVEEPGFISIVVMVETACVLERSYNLNALELSTAIERMLQIDVLDIQHGQEVFTAMIALKEGRGSFADALIAELAHKAGCNHTVTFDQRALRLDGFKSVYF